MGDGNKHLGPFPGRTADQIDHALLRDNVVGLAAGVRYDIALEMGDDIGMAFALLVNEEGVHADKGFAAPCHGGPGHIIQLAAGTADLAQAHAFRADLSVQVDGNAAVDGDHIIELGDGGRIVDKFQRLDDDARIHIDPVVELFGAEDNAGHSLAPLKGLAFIGQLAGLIQFIIGVPAELRMHAQVFYICKGQHGADDIGHGADAQLQGGAVMDEGYDVGGDLYILFGRGLDGEFRKGRMLAFHDVVDLGDMDAFVKAAQDPGQTFIDLYNHHISLLQDTFGNAGGTGQVEIAVAVHGRDRAHGYIDGQEMPVIGDQQVKDHGDVVAQAPVTELALIGAAVPGIIDEMLTLRVTFHCLNRSETEVAPDLDIMQLLLTVGQGPVQQIGKTHVAGIVDPVAAFDDFDRLLRRSVFSGVFFTEISEIHSCSPVCARSRGAAARGNIGVRYCSKYTMNWCRLGQILL